MNITMSESLGNLIFISLVAAIVYYRFVWLRKISDLTHTGSAPVFLGTSQGNFRVIGFLDIMLTPAWLIKEWSSQQRYNSIELKNGKILNNVLIQSPLDDFFRRFSVSMEVTDIILNKNEIVGFVNQNGTVYSLKRFSSKVEEATGKPVQSIG